MALRMTSKRIGSAMLARGSAAIHRSPLSPAEVGAREGTEGRGAGIAVWPGGWGIGGGGGGGARAARGGGGGGGGGGGAAGARGPREIGAATAMTSLLSSSNCSPLSRNAGAETFSAAQTSPFRSRTGAATALSPSWNSP